MRPATWSVAITGCACVIWACGGTQADPQAKGTTPSAAETADEAPEASANDNVVLAAPAAEGAAPVGDDDTLKLPVQPPLAAEVNAGVIPRAALNVVLVQGIGRFLQNVRVERHMLNDRFAGWRILTLFPGQPYVHVAVLLPGDTVRRANGKSMEHPETFKAVWDGLATAKELVLDIERAGRPSKLRYTISD